jgi:fucose permease
MRLRTFSGVEGVGKLCGGRLERRRGERVGTLLGLTFAVVSCFSIIIPAQAKGYTCWIFITIVS